MTYISHKRANTIRFYLYDVARVVKFVGAENGMVVARGWGREGMESYCLMSTRVSVGKMRTFLRWMVVMVAQQCEYT